MRNIRFILSRLRRAPSYFTAGACHSASPRLMSPPPLLNDIFINLSPYKFAIGAHCFASTDSPPHIVVEMPALSPTMNQGNIAKWRKKEGDKISVGDVICEIETDKATLEFEYLEEGYLAKILAPEGAKDVLVGQAIAVTVEDPDDIKNLPNVVPTSAEASGKKPAQDTSHKEGPQKMNINRISPSAKFLISEHGLDPTLLKASGPRGTLLKIDVLEAVKSIASSFKTEDQSQEQKLAHPDRSVPPILNVEASSGSVDTYEDLPNSQIRKVIAKRLLESKKGIPHLYISSDVILDPLLAFRKELKEQHNLKVSVNDIIIKAVAMALRNVPQANSYWNNEKGEVSLCNSIDISIAVATDKGLMTPIIRNADQKTFSAISSEVKDLAEKARMGKLAPHEFQGGTFSISNLGMYPVDHFCAIINPPQACILAVGRGNKVVAPIVGIDGIEMPAAVTKLNLTLSVDHRVFDENLGGKFLSVLGSNFADIRKILV